MHMNSILNRKLGFVLRMMRLKANCSQRDLADSTGVSQPTISRWENGTGLPDQCQSSLLCRLIGHDGSLARLLKLHGSADEKQFSKKLGEVITVMLGGLTAMPAMAGSRGVPYFADVAAGPGETQEQRSAPRSYIEVPRHIYEQDPECYALRVVGDSMAPRLTEGDIIVVSPAAPLPNGCMVAAFVEPLGDVVKVYNRDTSGSVRLSSLNPAYPEIYLDSAEGPAGRVWGRVVLQQREL